MAEPLPEDPKERQRIMDIFGDSFPGDMTQCSGYYTWSDLIDKYTRLDRHVWDTQWLCKRPDTQGLVYPRLCMSMAWAGMLMAVTRSKRMVHSTLDACRGAKGILAVTLMMCACTITPCQSNR